VPHCYGWLALDARGDWYMRDERIQAAGPFPQVKGSRIEHEKLRDFIARNYASDAQGCWFFQNGPQRVYLQLQAAPWTYRLNANLLQDGLVHTHTGLPSAVEASWLDEQDRLFLSTPLGLGLVHSMDMDGPHWRRRRSCNRKRARMRSCWPIMVWCWSRCRPPKSMAMQACIARKKADSSVGFLVGLMCAQFVAADAGAAGACGSSNLAPPWLAM
ncbi:DUF2946 family protein, partial [Roseateles sp. GG27B]